MLDKVVLQCILFCFGRFYIRSSTLLKSFENKGLIKKVDVFCVPLIVTLIYKDFKITTLIELKGHMYTPCKITLTHY